MNCEWGHDDCEFEGSKCELCFTDSQCYKAKPQRKWGLAKHAQKADKRMGSNFEFSNHKRNNAVLKDTVSGMTLNSGATVFAKGDEQILGNIRIMEELKTKIVQKTPGVKTFTIKKSWLEKLHNEAIDENMEFWYLKFSFLESDDDVYIIVEQDTIMSMVKTMVEDRRAIKKVEALALKDKKRRELVEADLVAAQAKIALLEEELKQAKTEQDIFAEEMLKLSAG